MWKRRASLFFNAVKEKGLEGIIAKHAKARTGRAGGAGNGSR